MVLATFQGHHDQKAKFSDLAHLPIFICLQEEQGMDLQSLNIESLEQLKYTSCVIKETLRINPPVPGGFRVALKTFELNVSRQTSQNSKSVNGILQRHN